MELAHTFSGGAPIVKKYLASAAISTAGIVLEASDTATTSSVGSVQAPPAAGAAQTPVVGLCIDTVASFPADPDGQVNTDASVFVSVIVNPDAIYRVKMSGGSAADTALSGQNPSAADTLGEATGVTALAGGIIWGFSGANVGTYRICDNTAGNVAISFPNGILTTDEYLVACVAPGRALATANNWFDLTTDLTQAVVNAASTDNDNFVVVDVQLGDASNDGKNNSYLYVVPNSHVFAGGTGIALS